MSDSSNQNLTRRVRRLTFAFWIAFGVAIIALISTYIAWSGGGKFLHYLAFGFERMSLQKQIQTSTVIVLSKWEKSGNFNKCIITDILKHEPGVQFEYQVGDEFRPASLPNRQNTDYGDGQVIFFDGSPARLRYATSYSAGRIDALGGLSVDSLRIAINQSRR
jgi:hypothetical protein